MIKYKLRFGWRFEISEVKVTRETEATVFFIGDSGKEFSERKETSHHRYFNTFEEAKQWAISIAESRIQVKQTHLEIEFENLKRAKELTLKTNKQ